MPAFQVQDCKDGPGKSPWIKIVTENAREAAEKICAVSLRDRGKPGELRARVVRDGDLARKETAFYADRS